MNPDMREHEHGRRLVICTRDDGCDDLERHKRYRVLPDDMAEAEGFLRVIDDSGEDYLYPASYFLNIELSQESEEALRRAS